GADTTGTVINGNRIGTDVSGNAARGNGNAGVFVESTSVTLGTPGGPIKPGGPNIISGNLGAGVVLSHASNVTVANNYIGLNNAGRAAVPNGDVGVLLLDTSSVTIGGGDGAANYIAGNQDAGILLDGAWETLIQGNTIGLDRSSQKDG